MQSLGKCPHLYSISYIRCNAEKATQVVHKEKVKESCTVPTSKLQTQNTSSHISTDSPAIRVYFVKLMRNILRF